MTRNMGRIDQFLRIVIGLVLLTYTVLTYTVKEGSITAGWLVPGVVGAILIITAFFAYCPLYTVLGMTTRTKLDRTT